MHIKLDEDMPRRVLTLLREHGYTVSSVHEEGLQGTKDSLLWQIVQQQGYFFITADKGFGDLRHYPPGTHRGILLLRPDEEGALAYEELIRSVIKAVRLESLSGALAVATPRGLRIRRTGL
jgi:predicted nuclease of predicted toxin-antitoxin system